MEKSDRKFSDADINHLNEKVIQSQLFTPDRVYIELGLLKDIPIGVMYTDKLLLNEDVEGFEKLQSVVLECSSEYQKRTYDTIEPFFESLGYDDSRIEELLNKKEHHDKYFLTSPTTQFLGTLIKHTVRNKNNSRPANKYTKKPIGNKQYVLESVPITFLFNTFPLLLSSAFMTGIAREFGEAFGVNIEFMSKDPSTFDQRDWDTWLKDIDCFYLDSLGRFTKSPIAFKKQEEMEFVGKYLFARKRFEKRVMEKMKFEDFTNSVQILTSRLDIFFEFSWLQNNEVRLTEEADDVSVETPAEETEMTSGV